jgi:pyridoxal phosphate enzyme (YggS family)
MAERAAGRPEKSVRLIAVSKTQPAEALISAYRHGQRDFGENYLQEALAKQDRLAHFDIAWHFIGPIQSNKTKPIAARFAWVHSVDRLKIAERLSEQRPSGLPPLNICIQANVSGEASKSGVAIEELPALVEAIVKLPRLRLRGLMAIPAPADDPAQQRIPFRILRQAFEDLSDHGLDTLSMGMSEDLEAAVLEGATLVRIGSALFGPRPG